MPTFRDDVHRGSKVPLVKTDDLNDKCVTPDKLADEAFKTDNLAEGCVTEEKIAVGAVTPDKLKYRPFERFGVCDGEKITGYNAKDLKGTFNVDTENSDLSIEYNPNYSQNGFTIGAFEMKVNAISNERIHEIAEEVFNN